MNFLLLNRLKVSALLLIPAVIAGVLMSSGCNSNGTVADFSASAKSAISTGTPIIGDLSGTCGREVANRQLAGTFSTDETLPAECQAIAQQAQGMTAASKVVYEYFSALNDLASFNTAKTAGNLNQLVSDAGDLARLSPARRDAFGALGQLVTTITTSAYQTKHLRDDVVKADTHLQVALTALEQTVTDPGMYLDLINREKASRAARSKEFLLTHSSSPESTLILDHQWSAERGALDAKANAANAYVAALQVIGRGHRELVEHSRTLNGKELLAVLRPYVDQLVPLVPAIRNGF